MAPLAASLRSIMLATILVGLFVFYPSVAAALPGVPKSNQRTCTNHVVNPSFETGSTTPWLPIVESAWSTRGVFADPFTHSGTHHYYAHATSTVDSSFTLSQSGVDVPVGSTVDCHAWVASKRSEGATRVEVFLDGLSCGAGQLGVGEQGWKRVGGKIKAVGAGNGMVGSTIAVVATSKSAGDEGWEIWFDDVGVASC
ncbi:hypothetical protein SVAN01_09745 [Stagonosporopsis vannaccii]|nr:hypothetical protein SVAN01_09745 [Stagonosporopsis vannaccii]